MEKWKKIIETNNVYSVSNKGKIRNDKTGKILKQSYYHNGYLGVGIIINGKQKRYRVHRLVAEYFVENPLNLCQVNHKDECKTNNCSENLEWCTSKYNINYGKRTERMKEKLGNKVVQFEKDGTKIREYPSIIEASRIVGCDESGIRRACKGEYKQYKGYKWQYAVL